MQRLFRNNRSNNTETDETEDNSGKYKEDTRSPLVWTDDLHNGIVQVEMFILGLEPGRDKYHPKGGRIWFDFFNGGRAFDMKTVLVDKVKMLRTTYKFRVNKLPGRIIATESTWKVEKGKIVVKMEKHPDDINIDWMPTVRSRGLDLESSSSSSSDDD
ncbi:hypothetical protein BsWGS_07197 [Bradybaena similaris]